MLTSRYLIGFLWITFLKFKMAAIYIFESNINGFLDLRNVFFEFEIVFLS